MKTQCYLHRDKLINKKAVLFGLFECACESCYKFDMDLVAIASENEVLPLSVIVHISTHSLISYLLTNSIMSLSEKPSMSNTL